MSSKSFSLFEKAWFYQKLVSKYELTEIVTKCTSMPYVAQPEHSSSINRLIINQASDFVLPDFLKMTIGAQKTTNGLPYHIERRSTAEKNINFVKKHLHDCFTSKNNYFWGSVENLYLEIEIFFEEVPILITYCLTKDLVLNHHKPFITIYPYGKYELGKDYEISMQTESGFGAETLRRIMRFLEKFDLISTCHEQRNHNKCVEIFYDHPVISSVFDKLILAVSQAERCISLINFSIPHMSNGDDAKALITSLLSESSEESQISFYLRLSNSYTFGFIADGNFHLHDSIGCFDYHSSFIQEYSQEHKRFLVHYVDWLSRTGHLKTVSGVLAAYALFSHYKDGLTLVVMPVGDKFIVCLTPLDLSCKVKNSAKLFSFLGSVGDWVEGKIPVNEDYKLSIIYRKDDGGVGEYRMPVLQPFKFHDPEIYIKKEKERIKNKKKPKAAKEGSLQDQLNKITKAGLVLSPSISEDDFLMSESEESYENEPYIHLCWQLTNLNEVGEVFCPQAFAYNEYYLPENEYMDAFQRICRHHSLKIDNIKSKYYSQNDYKAEGLKQISFTTNGEKVIWTFGSDASENKYYEWLNHAQRFFQERFEDLQIYEIAGVNRLLCLSEKAAENISKLLKIHVIQLRDGYQY